VFLRVLSHRTWFKLRILDTLGMGMTFSAGDELLDDTESTLGEETRERTSPSLNFIMLLEIMYVLLDPSQ